MPVSYADADGSPCLIFPSASTHREAAAYLPGAEAPAGGMGLGLQPVPGYGLTVEV
ncbi:hypothetical protein GCM10022226_03600 [Sphaerisporangium flaviroseum]|uniref:Uncharacterized protein n=1 Tax=Sphaerisporangium flaviroseum TaxID=509199 RepID=A0ABP7H8W0_9ACTN